MSEGGSVKGWFQLERSLLRDRSLPPIPKLVLQDLLDRTKHPRRAGDAGTTDRAADLGITRPTLQAAEDWLEANGYLLRYRAQGRRNVYLARYPAVPVGHADRPAFEAEFSALCTCKESEHVKPVSMQAPFTATCKADLQDSPDDTFSNPSEKGEKSPPLIPPRGREVFRRLAAKGEDLEAIQAGVERYAAWAKERGNEGTPYIQQIPTFLNGRGWEEPWVLTPATVTLNGHAPPPRQQWSGRGLRPGQTVQDRKAELVRMAEEAERRG
jgi:hypothetical protein